MTTTWSSTSTATWSTGSPNSPVIGDAPSTGSMLKISVTLVPSIAAVATGSTAETVTISVAFESCSWWRISSGVYVGLSVVTVPPATATPWNTTAYSGMFGAMIASVSPTPNPRAWSPPAKRRMASRSSA